MPGFGPLTRSDDVFPFRSEARIAIPPRCPLVPRRFFRSCVRLSSDSYGSLNASGAPGGASTIGALDFLRALLSGGCGDAVGLPDTDPVDEPGLMIGGLVDCVRLFVDSGRIIGGRPGPPGLWYWESGCIICPRGPGGPSEEPGRIMGGLPLGGPPEEPGRVMRGLPDGGGP